MKVNGIASIGDIRNITLNGLLSKITFWKTIGGILVILGLYASVVRFGSGLGAATALNDRVPWGLWIGFDVLCGVALAAGGFLIAATVHIFHIDKYKPILRPTILTAFLGYLLVCFALLYDLGRFYNIWHPLIMWNPHSAMFEVAWCVMLYTTVLSLEFSPIVFEKLRWQRALNIMKSLSILVIIMGVILSTLHQSSLGTLFVIAPGKLHPLWYSPFLPLFFFISAIGVGLAMTILESFLSYRFFKKELEMELLVGLGRVIVVVMAVYLVVRLFDMINRNAIPYLFKYETEALLFWIEMLLGGIAPMLLLAVKKIRLNRKGLFVSAFLVILGLILNRLNVAITGFESFSGVHYFPSFEEISISIFMVTMGFIVFAVATKYLPIFTQNEH